MVLSTYNILVLKRYSYVLSQFIPTIQLSSTKHKYNYEDTDLQRNDKHKRHYKIHSINQNPTYHITIPKFGSFLPKIFLRGEELI